MGSHRSKEDEVQKISTSVFITNFPDLFTAKDLFNTCKQYGHVVDAFIPNKGSKAEKRFDFVRFIKIFDVERSVNNLCTVWVGRFKLHANIARFQRTPLNNESTQVKNKFGENRSNTNDYNKEKGVKGVANSYVHAVKGGPQYVNVEIESTPALVLDEECLNSKDLSNSLLGRVKEFASLSNLKMVLTNEGLDNIKIKYMGGFWVLLEFASEALKMLFPSNVGAGSWFSHLIQASMDFTIDGRVAWVEIEGIPFKMWSVNTFKRIASKWGVLLHVDDQEDDCFHRKRMCINTKVGMNIFESFKIIIHGKVFWIRAKEVPRWVPDFMEENDEDYDTDSDTKEGGSKGEDASIFRGESDVEEVPETMIEDGLHNPNLEEVSIGQKDKHSEDLFNLYDVLNKKNNVVDKGNNSKNSLKYPLGFTPTDDIEEHCKKDEESKKESGEYSQRYHEEEINTGIKDKCSNKSSKEDAAESVCSGHFKKSEIPRIGGSILNLIDESVKVGQTMRYNMEGCMKNMEEIIESQGVNDVYR
ncbi:nucleotide-binding alpha-beta plait domain-containing protein [Tanacetum coccineum]|uniref:Nucleotide-binding alpha-beta plait domain-containing protein n=1 Tax=Tanacetum coccineum TaxID=301880 RepID=A0ABQ4Z8P8_9ASTR